MGHIVTQRISIARRQGCNSMNEESELLASIADKLDVLIAISRLANKEKIQSYSDQIKKDPIYSKILEITMEPTSYGNLSRVVAEATNAAEITVKRKVADLREIGAIAAKRKGRDAIYENTGLLA